MELPNPPTVISFHSGAVHPPHLSERIDGCQLERQLAAVHGMRGTVRQNAANVDHWMPDQRTAAMEGRKEGGRQQTSHRGQDVSLCLLSCHKQSTSRCKGSNDARPNTERTDLCTMFQKPHKRICRQRILNPTSSMQRLAPHDSSRPSHIQVGMWYITPR